MKTGNFIVLTALIGVLAVPAFAQTDALTVPPATVTEAAPMAPTVVQADMPVAAAPIAVPASATAIPVGTSGVIVQGAPSVSSTDTVTTPPKNMPANTPTVVTQVMENLQQNQNNVSVEDLSKAQDALTRLDLLLQLEKKIGEIKKTQDDREDTAGTGGGMMGQVPASALVLPNGQPGGAMAQSAVISTAPAITGASSYEVEQISGTNGSYSAILTTPDGDRKTVRTGDKLDGRTVQSIGLDGVQLSGSSKKSSGKILAIHNDGVLLTPMAR